MRDNWNTLILGQKVHLVPYRKKFVEKYHEWMTDEHILEMTASEPLTLQEEYSMQKEWMEDPKKCTFLIADSRAGSLEDRLVGDINLFFSEFDGIRMAEVDIMVAIQEYRRRGFGKEAVEIILVYAANQFPLDIFFCKIKANNIGSLALFRSLGFTDFKFVEVFQEIELRLKVPEFLQSYVYSERCHSFQKVEYYDSEDE